MRYKLLFLTAIIAAFTVAIVIAPVTAQEDFTDNHCFDLWTWCGDGSTPESLYWWEAGWCAAAIDANVVTGAVEDCTSSPDDVYKAPPIPRDDGPVKRDEPVVEPDVKKHEHHKPPCDTC